MSATPQQRDLLAKIVEAYVENLYDDWREGADSRDDYEEMFEDHGPGAVEALRATGPLLMDTGNWRAVEDALELTVLREDEGYAAAFDVTVDEIIAAAAAIGITPAYYDGPKRGDQ